MIPLDEVWLRAWCATASAGDCRTCDVADDWADHAVKQYKARFAFESPERGVGKDWKLFPGTDEVLPGAKTYARMIEEDLHRTAREISDDVLARIESAKLEADKDGIGSTE